MIELTPQSFVFVVIGLAFGLLVGWLVARRRTHAAEVRLATAEASLKSAADVATERDRTHSPSTPSQQRKTVIWPLEARVVANLETRLVGRTMR